MNNIQLSSALQTMQKLNNQLDTKMSLSSEQLKEQKVQNLKDEMIKAQNRMQNSPQEYEKAKKDYYTELKGSNYYSNMERKKYENEARTHVSNWNKDLVDKIYDSITNSINFYNTQSYYKNNVDDVYKNYDSELSDIKKKIYDTEQVKNVNERMGQFYNNNTEFVSWWNYYLKVFYYFLIASSIFIFIYKKQFRKIKFYLFFVVILMFPYLLNKYYNFIMRTFRHFKLDNVYFIFAITMMSAISFLTFISKFPFN